MYENLKDKEKKPMTFKHSITDPNTVWSSGMGFKAGVLKSHWESSLHAAIRNKENVIWCSWLYESQKRGDYSSHEDFIICLETISSSQCHFFS